MPTSSDRANSLRIVVLTHIASQAAIGPVAWHRAQAFIERMIEASSTNMPSLAQALQEDLDYVNSFMSVFQEKKG